MVLKCLVNLDNDSKMSTVNLHDSKMYTVNLLNGSNKCIINLDNDFKMYTVNLDNGSKVSTI